MDTNLIEVPFELFSSTSDSPVDLFIRVSDVRHIKIYTQEEPDLDKIIKKYLEKNLISFYCRKNEYEELTNFLLQKSPKPSITKKVSIVQQTITLFGITESVAKQIEDIKQKNITIIKKDKKLAKLLSEMMDAGDYLSQHSTMVAFVACALAEKVDWSSPAVLMKLSLAGILHDMFLTPELLLKVKDYPHGNDKLTWREKKQYKSHIKDIIHVLEFSKEIPADVSDIINDHHQFSSDDLFPTTKTPSSISQISALFILADMFCQKCHKENDVYVDDFIADWDKFKEEYNKGNFRKPIEALSGFLNLK